MLLSLSFVVNWCYFVLHHRHEHFVSGDTYDDLVLIANEEDTTTKEL